MKMDEEVAEPPSLINGLGGVKPSSTINKNLRRINPKPELRKGWKTLVRLPGRWLVETILARWRHDDIDYYLVKWHNFNAPSWEPSKNLHGSNLHADMTAAPDWTQLTDEETAASTNVHVALVAKRAPLPSANLPNP